MQRPKTLREIVHDTVLDALIRHNASREHASTELGINRKTLYNIIVEMRSKGIHVPDGNRKSGMERLMQELKEYRQGKRISHAPEDYCKECGRLYNKPIP